MLATLRSITVHLLSNLRKQVRGTSTQLDQSNNLGLSFALPEDPIQDRLYKNICSHAFHDSSRRQLQFNHLSAEQEATLRIIFAWIEGSDLTNKEKRILWLDGPGTGTSVISQSVANGCNAKKVDFVTFFFSRISCFWAISAFFFSLEADCDTTKRFWTTLAYQFAQKTHLRSNIGTAVNDGPSTFYVDQEDQLQNLIVIPLEKYILDNSQTHGTPFLVIIDGLDKCKDNKDRCNLLHSIVDVVAHQNHLPLRFMIASRPEQGIRDVFERPEVQNFCYRVPFKKNETWDTIYTFLRGLLASKTFLFLVLATGIALLQQLVEFVHGILRMSADMATNQGTKRSQLPSEI